MARETKAEAFEYVERTVPENERGFILTGIMDDIWFCAGLDHYPSGLDYYMLDCAVTVGYDTTERWLGIILDIPEGCDKFWVEATKRLRRYPDLEAVICGMEMFRRRRARAEPDWKDNSSALVNRFIRTKSRAIKMLGKTAAEVAA